MDQPITDDIGLDDILETKARTEADARALEKGAFVQGRVFFR